MKLSDFDIEFIKFKNEKDTFTFKLNDTFFQLKENSLYDRCDIDAKIDCLKNDNTLVLDYTLIGTVFSSCERCLSEIKLLLDSTRNEVLKLTSNEDLLQEENYLSVNNQVYSTYDSLYEEICLSMPTRLICENSLTNKQCEIDHSETADEDVVDERWSELKKLIK
ncbi:DUF177 domain-containing protein [Bacteroidia bacterium]|jgi:uncharacterized protein|nr:DUF177 domain-containing protein [Bacteroidota bacterium]MDA8930999.1 DUF177 domain-containing protein [Bacteroidia bacterium]MDB4174302.1 DUF177 domain-containing protein [Bacteroidia bacterium]